MPDEVPSAVEHARSASPEELKSLVHDGDEATLLALLENPSLDETHVTRLLERLDLSARVLTAIVDTGKWTSSEAIRWRLARHPRAPRRAALALLRQLFLFDLVRVSLMPSAPADIRRAAEAIVLSRVPHLPVGEKLALARRGPSRVAGAILAEGHPQAIKLALGNAFLTESQLLKVLSRQEVPERVVAGIAQHSKWAYRYNVRLALLRNLHTPVPVVLEILPNLTARDLRETLAVESLAPHLHKYVQQELSRRAAAGIEYSE